jgi:diguanylate cyclase (GGDEF)-like protein
MFALRQNSTQLWIWSIAPAYLLVHGIVATCLPHWLDPLSTIFIVLAELAALAVSLLAAKSVSSSVRMLWLLLACSILFHSIAMSLDAMAEITGAPVFNYVPGFQIYFSMLYGVPLLVAVSLQSDQRILRIARTIHSLLSLAIGIVLYLEIFTLLTVSGSKNPAAAVLIARMFDWIDLFLAVAATIRWMGSEQSQEIEFFRILSIFLWINAVLPGLHNRILIRHDFVWLDLFISAPYAFLFVLILTAQEHPRRPPSRTLVRVVRSGSPIFLTMALVTAGVFALQSHFYIGLGAILFAIAGYGTFNILVQSREFKTEESLLAVQQTLEKLVAADSLTGIANRRAFDKVLSREFAAARRTKAPLSLLMIDVDYFKDVNDRMGHQVGDDYLVRIAEALRLALPRVTDFVARYGGEEFLVILPATSSIGATQAAEKLRKKIVNLGLRHPTTPLGVVTISIGLSTFDGSVQLLPKNLIRAADRALYLAKNRGRNRVELLLPDRAEV